MKKYLPLVCLLILSGAGCSTFPEHNRVDYSQTNANGELTVYQDREFAELVNQIKNSQNSQQQSPNQPDNDMDKQEKKFTLKELSPVYKQAEIKTNMGDIVVEFYDKESPITVNNFLNLAQSDFYNGTKFHRVIKDFMIQGGDPLSKDDDPTNDGRGGPGYSFIDEINQHKLVKGSLAMANSGPNTNGSQFFIVTADAAPWLDGKHTNFGYVVEGMEVVEKIENIQTGEGDRSLEQIVIVDIELIER